MLVLQVVVQPEALAGEVLADHRHPEVRALLAAVLLRERVAVVAGRVGAPARLAQQRLPLLVRQAAAVPVGAGVLAAVVEEADVVVLLLERLDLTLDELVELDEVLRQIRGMSKSIARPLRRRRYLIASGLIGEPTASVNLIGGAVDEELPHAVGFAVVGELVEVEDLAERHAHVADEHHVHRQQLGVDLARQHLDRPVVGRDDGDLVVVQPLRSRRGRGPARRP